MLSSRAPPPYLFLNETDQCKSAKTMVRSLLQTPPLVAPSRPVTYVVVPLDQVEVPETSHSELALVA